MASVLTILPTLIAAGTVVASAGAVAAVVVGAVWLALPLVFALLQMPIVLPDVLVQGWPLQTLLLVGGVAGGVLLGLLSRVFVEAAIRSIATCVSRASV